MIHNNKEFFSTKELHELHPELAVREDRYNGRDYAAFFNAGRIVDNVTAEWPVGVELWVGHEHERNVDNSIYDPLCCYFDRRGLTESLSGSVFGEIGTMAEVLTQHLYGGYFIDVMFGELTKPANSRCRFLVHTPHDAELALNSNPTPTQCVMIRILNDTRRCAMNGTINESDNLLHHCIQYADDDYRRYEFLFYPLSGATHSSRAQAIAAKDYVHFYAAMYDSVIMLAHHERAKRESSK